MSTPILILAGLPAFSIGRKNKQYEFNFQGWDCRQLNAQSKEVDLSAGAWAATMAAIAEHERSRRPDQKNSGAHVLAFHKDARQHGRYRCQISPYHRLIFLPMSILSAFAARAAFDAALLPYIQFEKLWREKVRPADESAPLLLPEQHFVAPTRYKSIWRHAREIVLDVERCGELEKTIARFKQQLRSNRGSDVGYLDELDRLFTYNGALHGISDIPRDDWKFTMQMIAGFHYDVSPIGKKGRIRLGGDVFQDHVNVYPHGFVRGGT